MMGQMETIDEWHSRIRRKHFAHNVAAAKYDQLNRYFGFTATAMSAIVGTSIFATLLKSPSLYVKIIVGLVSITAAVITSLLTFLNYSVLTEKHHTTAKEYGDLRRTVEKLWISPLTDEGLRNDVDSIDQTWCELGKKSPVISPRIWAEADRRIKSAKKASRK